MKSKIKNGILDLKNVSTKFYFQAFGVLGFWGLLRSARIGSSFSAPVGQSERIPLAETLTDGIGRRQVGDAFPVAVAVVVVHDVAAEIGRAHV